MSSKERTERLDKVLTGLAMYDAYVTRDAETLASLTAQVPAREAVDCLLSSMEVMGGMFAAQLRTSPTEVTASVRRRIIREIAEAAPNPRRRAS